MIVEAHKEGVSDIHIESYPGREKIRIRFRKDGLLRTYLELPASYRNAMIARIKIMCDLDISEKRKPQDGKINFAKFSPQHKIELRVASIPTNSGLEDVVMRILASAKPIPLDRLGLSDYNLTELKKAVERPYGMVLCVGPTGSARRPRCTRRSATSTCPSARSGPPRTRSRSPSPGCARCRSTRRSTGPSRRRCAPSCVPTRT